MPSAGGGVDNLGVVPVTLVPVLLVTAITAGVLVGANVIAIAPAWSRRGRRLGTSCVLSNDDRRTGYVDGPKPNAA
jgi:hypothetical protein